MTKKFIPYAKIGNLDVMYCVDADFLNDKFTTEILILNGGDVVYKDLYASKNIDACVDNALKYLDIFTYDYLLSIHAVPTEYDGIEQIHIAGVGGVDYFKKFDNAPQYFKHYTYLPVAWSEKYQKYM